MSAWHRLWTLLPLILVVIIWETISRSHIVNPALFPPPSDVALVLGAKATRVAFAHDITESVGRLLMDLSIGCMTGILLGLATGRIPLLARALAPIIHTLRPLPPVALIPLFIVWFGIGDPAKIVSIAFAVFFPVWINAHIGAERVPRIYLWSAQALAASRLKTLYSIIFPSALPFIVAGVRTGIAFAFIMIFVSELAGSSAGIGYRISVSHLAYRIDEMMAALFVLGALGALSDLLFVRSIKALCPWLQLTHH